jgi:hypothetical protein
MPLWKCSISQVRLDLRNAALGQAILLAENLAPVHNERAMQAVDVAIPFEDFTRR